MTLGAEEEKQFHSRFPFSRPLIPSPLILRSRSLSFSLLYFFIRHSSPVHHVYDPTWAGTRMRNASCSWSPRNRNDCNLHKLSFHFDDDVTEAPKAEKRGIVNDREDRILCTLYFRSSWYNMEFLARKTKLLYLIYIIFWLSLRYIKSQNKIKI